MQTDESPTEGMRLQRYLALAGVASRRAAEDLIRAGRVTINKKIAILGNRVPEDAKVCVDGQRVVPAISRVLLVAYKPTGMMTTLRDPEGRPTIAQLIPKSLRLHPVGRLDYDTSGLLLLTNDGSLTHVLTHPRYGVEKTYRVQVRGRLGPEALLALQEGVTLEEGTTQPAKVRVIASRRILTTVDLTIHEGRNRQVRRMLEELGHPVDALTRTVFGPFRLGTLSPGEVREASDLEWAAVERIVGLASEDEDDG